MPHYAAAQHVSTEDRLIFFFEVADHLIGWSCRGTVRGFPLGVKYPNSQSMRLGAVIRRAPGITRWAAWSWRAVAVLPGAPDADWKELRSDDGITDFHAATTDLWLYVSDTEAYAHELGAEQPSVYVILRTCDDDNPAGLRVVHITASPYEAQDYADSGEEIVEKVPMPDGLLAWVAQFVEKHHVEEVFVKRRRNKERTDRKDDGIGDYRISQKTDVYRAPTAKRHEAAE